MFNELMKCVFFLISGHYLRNNSWKPYVYIVFTRALARAKKLT